MRQLFAVLYSYITRFTLYGLKNQRIVLPLPEEARDFFLFCKEFRPVLKPKQLLTQQALGALSPGLKRLGSEAGH
jgi:hypothetical protein